jgi:hypothetical protein
MIAEAGGANKQANIGFTIPWGKLMRLQSATMF